MSCIRCNGKGWVEIGQSYGYVHVPCGCGAPIVPDDRPSFLICPHGRWGGSEFCVSCLRAERDAYKAAVELAKAVLDAPREAYDPRFSCEEQEAETRFVDAYNKLSGAA